MNRTLTIAARALCGLTLIAGLALSSPSLASQQEEHQRRIVTRAIAVRSVGQGFLGIQLMRLTPELRAHFGAPADAGVMVSRVEEDGPARAAGILVGDIVTAIDGERVDESRTLARAVRSKKEGASVTLELYRDGRLESYPVTVDTREREVFDLAGDGYHFFSDSDSLPGHDVVINGPELRFDAASIEAFEQAMRELEDHFGTAEWQEKIERMKTMDFDAIQTRMKEVEQRLKQLETELGKGMSQK